MEATGEQLSVYFVGHSPPSQNFSLNIKKILLCRPCLTLRRKSSPWKMRMEGEDKILKMSNSWMKLGVISFILKVYYICMNTSGFGGGVLFAFGFIYLFWIKLANLCTSSGKFPQATYAVRKAPNPSFSLTKIPCTWVLEAIARLPSMTSLPH